VPTDAFLLRSERELAGLARALARALWTGLSAEERALVEEAVPAPAGFVARVRRAIERGQDPLGEAFCRLRSPARRRPSGAVYTPSEIVTAMVERASQDDPARVVDAGAGSGRFLLEAGRRFSRAELVAVETDPLARLLLRANVAVLGLGGRTRVLADDYRSVGLKAAPGKTLFLGNPPYVRHHLISSHWKAWLSARARELGLRSSQLAGLHAHFLLAMALQAVPGDAGVLITSAEWLDTSYGSLVRELLGGRLGVVELHLLEAKERAFAGVDTTAVIVRFEVGARKRAVRLRHVRSLAELWPLAGGRAVRRERLLEAPRWTPLVRARPAAAPDVPELGEFFEVHRGQVTGANRVWIAGEHSLGLPASVLFPSVTRARELFRAGAALTSLEELRNVIDLPAEIDVLSRAERRTVEQFLTIARRMGADQGFIARHRKAWWSVGLHDPAPILVTYMARRPPAFVHNPAAARHLNIAHGLYPRAPLPARALARIARHLSEHTPLDGGRFYAGGLAKFEPGELLRLRIPGLAELAVASK
jgi:hypothetical protein